MSFRDNLRESEEQKFRNDESHWLEIKRLHFFLIGNLKVSSIFHSVIRIIKDFLDIQYLSN